MTQHWVSNSSPGKTVHKKKPKMLTNKALFGLLK